MAATAFLLKQYSPAISSFEEIARHAKLRANGFSGCPADRNYVGNFMSRALSGAFTIVDRFRHPRPGASWERYLTPADLEVPLLTPDD